MMSIIFNFLNNIPDYVSDLIYNNISINSKIEIERKRFKKLLGYYPDINNPKTFNEKILTKKLYDRNPILPIVSDKYRVRSYLKEILGNNCSNKILIPIYHVINNVEGFKLDHIINESVIKANHGSGTNIIVNDKNKYSLNYIKKIITSWLSEDYGKYKHEWAYQNIPKKIIIEKLLKEKNGNIPYDYKFFCFNGKCMIIQVDLDRHGDHKRSLYDTNWNLLNVEYQFKKGNYIPPPDRLNEMIKLAEYISEQFDFIRVDLYNVDGNIYFGELTNYPGSGCEIFNPSYYDLEFGKYWKYNSYQEKYYINN